MCFCSNYSLTWVIYVIGAVVRDTAWTAFPKTATEQLADEDKESKIQSIYRKDIRCCAGSDSLFATLLPLHSVTLSWSKFQTCITSWFVYCELFKAFKAFIVQQNFPFFSLKRWKEILWGQWCCRHFYFAFLLLSKEQQQTALQASGSSICCRELFFAFLPRQTRLRLEGALASSLASQMWAILIIINNFAKTNHGFQNLDGVEKFPTLKYSGSR